MSVSDTALGTMMLGASGNTDEDESVRMIQTAIDAGINFIDTADIYSRGESEQIVGKALKNRRDEVVLATKFGLSTPSRPDENDCGGSAALHRPGHRGEPAKARHRPRRPLPDAPPRPAHGYRRDARRPFGPCPRGQGACVRLLDLLARADRRSALDL